MPKKTGIVQIAEELGVSPSTVSRALRGDSRISGATRERVLAAALRHSYLPQAGRERVIAVLLTELNGSLYQARLLHEIQRRALRRRVRLELILSDALESLERHYWLGVLAIGFSLRQLEELAGSIRRPVVTINQPGLAGREVYGVVSDDHRIFRECFDLLTGAGHRRIGFLAAFHPTCIDNYNFHCRVDAYRSECRKRRLRNLETLLPLESGDLGEGVRNLLARDITALITLLPSVAGPLEYYLGKLPLKVPEELSVINWESPVRSEWVNIYQQFDVLAGAAFDAVELLAEQRETPVTRLIPYLLTSGGSVAPPGAREAR